MLALKRWLLLLLLFSLSLGLLATAIHSLTAGNTLGGDYYVFYLAGRAALQGENPYSDEIAIQVQLAMHKRLMGPGEDQLAFANPPFALIPNLLLLGLPFEWSQAIWMAFSLLACFILLIAASPGRPRPVIFSLLFLYPFAFGLILGNYVILLFCILIWIYARLTRPTGNSQAVQMLAGVLLAWCLVKPQFSWVFCGLLILLAVRRKEWWLPGSFLAGLGIFAAASFLLVPGWPALWLERLQKYALYNQTWLDAEFFLQQFLLPAYSRPASLVLLAALALTGIFLIIAWWRGKLPSLLLWGWGGVFGFLAHPRGKSYEHLVFVLPLLTWVLLRPSKRPLPVILFWGGSLIFSWVAFFLQRNPATPPAIAEAPLVLLPLWLLWMLTRPAAELPADASQNPV